MPIFLHSRYYNRAIAGGHCVGVKIDHFSNSWISHQLIGLQKDPKFYVSQTKNTDKYVTQTFIV